VLFDLENFSTILTGGFNMAWNMFDEITFVVREDSKGLVVTTKRVKLADVREERKALESRYPFPEFEILELVTEESGYTIRNELEIPQIKLTRDYRNKVQEQTKVDGEYGILKQLLEQLEQALKDKDTAKIEQTGAELEEKYRDQKPVLEKVGAAYFLNEKTRGKGIKLLEDTKAFSQLAEMYAAEQQWAESALSYYRAGEVAGEYTEKGRLWHKASYMHWVNHQIERAVEVEEKVLEIAENIGKAEFIKDVRNALAYYWAEEAASSQQLKDSTRENLEKARKWCLDMLDIPDDVQFIRKIEEHKLTEVDDAKVIDTLGRIMESLGHNLDAVHLYKKAREYTDNPVNQQNLNRTIRKLAEELRLPEVK
jgi:hypothetical protein